MKKFFVSTDSTCDLYAEEIRNLELGFLPLTLSIEEGDEVKFIPDSFQTKQQYVDFFNILRQGKNVKTAMNNHIIHKEYFENLAKSGVEDGIHFTISYGLARTMDIANEAIEEVRKQYPQFNMLVVESRTTTVGQGLLVRTAVEMRDKGKSLKETYDYVERMKKNIQHFVIVDDLDHLKRGGRISGAAAAIGKMAGLKVVINFDKDGKLCVIKKVIGGLKKAIKNVVEDYASFTVSQYPKRCIVVHCDNESGANELAAQLKSTYNLDSEIRIMGPTIGCHVGPNALAYIFVSDQERT